MKILEIRLKNLNSLVGEWRVDLTHPSFTGDGLFVITGPTGAGKTTLFDAVCLALYARTPRLGRVGGEENEIMSRRTGECLAQVAFSAAGGTYLCRWTQRRARGRGKGKLQASSHELSRADTGEILSTSRKETPRLVEEITGMDFERFTRAALLAQGRFDAFLRAAPDERARTLEMLTGTELYSRISKYVFTRCREERRKLEEMEARRGALTSPSSEEENAARQELERAQAEDEALRAEHERTREVLAGLTDLEALRAELNALSGDEDRLKADLEAFAPERERLEAAQRAAALEADYAPLVLLRSQVEKGSLELRSREAELPALREAAARSAGQLAEAQAARLAAREALDREAPLLQKARTLDLSLAASARSLQEAGERHARGASELAARRAEWERLREERDRASAAAQKAEEELAELLDGKLLREYRAERDARQREWMLQIKILSLEEERKQLRDGEPCPLCGAVRHPYAKGVAPAVGETEKAIRGLDVLIERAEALEGKRAALGTKLAALGTKLAALEAEVQAKDGVLAGESERLVALRAEGERLHRERAALYGERMPDVEEARLRATLERAELWEARAREEAAARGQAAVQAESALSALRGSTAQQERALISREAGFLARLSQTGFESEALFTAVRLDSGTLQGLKTVAAELEARGLELRSRRLERQETLDRRRAQAEREATPYLEEGADFSEAEALKAVQGRFAGEEARMRELQERAFQLRGALRRWAELREALGGLVEQCAAQGREAARWAELNSLIGSAEGQKYSVFAQRLTLDLVVEHANRQLRKMSSRYLLITQGGLEDVLEAGDASQGGFSAGPQGRADPLALSVIDGEQAGEVRPTANLSGGESFIVSLALALGLSQLSGRRTRVDSLFLDEGFGSLDEESLEMALEALGEVRREGRMIGIISHVQALKERVPTQIQVVPRSDGASVLSGPGCERKD